MQAMAYLELSEDMHLDEIKRQFETNLFGAIRTIKEVLLYNEKTKKWDNN